MMIYSLTLVLFFNIKTDNYLTSISCRVSHIIIYMISYHISSVRRHAIIWTNAGMLLFRPLGTNFSEILIEIHTFSFKKMHLKMSSGKWVAILSRLQCVNVCISNLMCSLCILVFVYILNIVDDFVSVINKSLTWAYTNELLQKYKNLTWNIILLSINS